MPKTKKLLLLFLTLFVVGSSAAGWRAQNSVKDNAKTGKRIGRLPVADYAAAADATGDAQSRAKRKAKSARYNQRGGEAIAELPEGIEQLPLTSHWWMGLSALPVNESNAVVIGEITDAQAFVSGDKTTVYSEFTIHLEEVLKSDTGATLACGNTITADRRGGGVRFPSGRVQRHVVGQMHMPGVGERYVLFLKANGDGQDFSILTGYELRAGKVSPLDGPEVYDERTRLPFAAYEGTPETDFLKTLHEAVNHATQVSSERGGRNQ